LSILMNIITGWALAGWVALAAASASVKPENEPPAGAVALASAPPQTV
jgi:hypothetical protein